MLTQDKINELREEYRLFLGSRCVNHPDFFPDECCGTTDWWISKIETLLKEREQSYKEELVDKIEQFSYIQNWETEEGKLYLDATPEEVINLIKDK